MSDAQHLIRKLTVAERAIATARKVLAVLQCGMMGTIIAALTLGAVRCPAQQLTNRALSVSVNRQDGSYQFGSLGGQSVLQAGVGALINHRWLRSSDYPSHSVSASPFSDALGSGQQLTVTCSGLPGSPDLIYVLQLYTENPYGAIQVRIRNTSSTATSVQAIPQC
jgi:alpha-galactosidase